jgi:Fic family protein
VGRLVRGTWPANPSGGRRADRLPCRYDAFVPDALRDLPLVLPAAVTATVADAERDIAALNASDVRLVSTEGVARILLRAESVASSRIEGLEVGGRHLAKLAAARTEGAELRDATAEAVLANIHAMVRAIELADRDAPLTVADLCDIHATLVADELPEEHTGRVRTEQNWIGGSSYNPCNAAFVPPPHELVPALLDDLMAFVAADTLPPLVQAAVAHAQFETIHPFVDGNGRVGRALVHVVLRRRGLAPRFVPPISLALATASRDYVRGLTAFRTVGAPDSAAATAGVAEWVDVFAAAALRATADARAFAARLTDLEQGWRTQAHPVRSGSATDLLLAALPGVPVVTVGTAAALIGRSFQATNEAVARLVDAGVLEQVTLGRRHRAFEAAGLIDALTAFERSLAVPEETDTTRPARPVPRRAGT